MGQGRFKRFYQSATADAEADAATGKFRILLDGRPVKTPLKAVLRLPRRALAEAAAGEWQAQGPEVDPPTMPLTALAITAIDLIGPARARIAAELAAFGAHDLLCYRAETPAELVARQQALWQPLLDWAARAFDAPLVVTEGIVAVTQPPASLEALRTAVARCDDFQLACLSSAVAASGSLVIGLALLEGRIDGAAAFEAARLDESYQIERWGEDPEAAGRRAAIRTDLEAVARAIALMRD